MGRPSSRDPRNVSKTVVKQSSTAEFQLPHLSVLREYLDMDICLGLRQEKVNNSTDQLHSVKPTQPHTPFTLFLRWRCCWSE